MRIWYFLLPVLAIAMFLFGLTRYRFNERTGRVSVARRDGFLNAAMALVMDGAFVLLFLVESSADLFQACLEHTGSSNPAWGVPVFLWTMLCIIGFGYSGFILVGEFGSHWGYKTATWLQKNWEVQH